MKRLILALLATAFVSPANAQHSGHNMPGMTMPMPGMEMPAKKKPAAKKKAPAKKAPAKKKATTKKSSATAKSRANGKQAPKKSAAQKPAAGDEDRDMSQMPGMEMPAGHEGHDMSQMPGMEMPAGHEGHDMSQMPGMEMPGGHAGRDMGAMAEPEPPVAGPPPEALIGPENAADAVWGTAAMQGSRAFLLTREHGGMTAAKLLIDQAEMRVRGGRNGYFLNAEGWYGADIDKLWLKTEIEGDFGHKPEQVEVQALWSHAIDPWVNLQTGIRLDAQPDHRARLVLGAEGLTPYWIGFDAAAFLSDKGDFTARAEFEHDVRITQKLILQPRAELDLALQDIPEERVGSGLSTAELGLRLRYQFVPNVAPYLGVSYERRFGDTRDFIRADGEDPDSLSFVVGLRTWF